MLNTLFSVVFYSLSLFTIFGIILSYWIAYRFSHSKSIFALLLFFIAIFIVIVVVTYNGLTELLLNNYTHVPFGWFRGLLLFSSSVYLFYWTWKEEKNKK